MNNPLVTVISATIGTKYLSQNILSVANQTYENVQHLIGIDGHHPDAKETVLNLNHKKLDVIELPYATGIDKYLGHRIYGGLTYIAKGEFICYLDEDNWMDPIHIESLIKMTTKNHWSYALRKIVDQDGNFICFDDCESLGKWPSVINDFLVDTNCFFLPKSLALHVSPLWYRKARQPGKLSADRTITNALRMLERKKIFYETSGEYTINYRAGNRKDSVQQAFFLKGNEVMRQRYQGNLPWVKKV